MEKTNPLIARASRQPNRRYLCWIMNQVSFSNLYGWWSTKLDVPVGLYE